MSADLKSPFEVFLFDALSDDARQLGMKLPRDRWLETAKRAHDAWHGARAPKRKPAVVSAEAEAIFALYPRKVVKQAALRAIVRVLDGRKVPFEVLEHRVKTYAGFVARWRKDDRQFVPHCSTWMNDGRYDDDPKEWERPNMAPIGEKLEAPLKAMKEPPNGWALRLKSTGSENEYRAGGPQNPSGAIKWSDIPPYYQRGIWKDLDAIV